MYSEGSVYFQKMSTSSPHIIGVGWLSCEMWFGNLQGNLQGWAKVLLISPNVVDLVWYH